MEILLWLVPAGVTTLVAMAVAGWVGREQRVEATSTSDRLLGEVRVSVDEHVSEARPARTAAPAEEPPAQRPPAPARRSA